MAAYEKGDRVRITRLTDTSCHGYDIGDICEVERYGGGSDVILRRIKPERTDYTQIVPVKDCETIGTHEQRPFKVGDHLVGLECPYSITCEGTHWVVSDSREEACDDETIRVIHDTDYPDETKQVGHTYWVNPKYFELTTSKEIKPMADITNPVTALKNAHLDDTTKILRKYGFEDSCGDMDSRGRDALMNQLWKERRAEFAEQLRELEDADKPDATV
jgi:hypothetical protein